LLRGPRRIDERNVMIFGRKSEPALVQLPALYEPPPQSLPASKAPVDEKFLRAKIWSGGFLGPDLARACGLSLSALVEFAQGSTSISAIQLAAISKFVGLGDGSVSGLTVISDAMERRCRNGRPDWGDTATTRNRVRPGGRVVERGRPGEDVLDGPGDEIEDDRRSLRHTANVQAFLAGDDRALSVAEIDEFVKDQYGPAAWFDPSDDVLRKRDTAIAIGPGPASFDPEAHVRAGNYPPMATGQEKYTPYPRDPSLPPPGPARLAPRPGWA
jgi:hypothetical protein